MPNKNTSKLDHSAMLEHLTNQWREFLCDFFLFWFEKWLTSFDYIIKFLLHYEKIIAKK